MSTGAAAASGAVTAAANTLEAMLARKQQLDDDLRSVERSVVEGEETYLEETNHYGNVVKGWDGFLTSRPKPHGASHHATKRVQVARKDRIWSLSSTSAPIQDSAGGGGDMDDDDGGNQGSSRGSDRRSHRMAKVDEGGDSD